MLVEFHLRYLISSGGRGEKSIRVEECIEITVGKERGNFNIRQRNKKGENMESDFYFLKFKRAMNKMRANEKRLFFLKLQ